MQTKYVYIYEKINKNKVMCGLTQYSKRKIFVLGLKFLVSWKYSHNKYALAQVLPYMYYVIVKYLKNNCQVAPGIWTEKALIQV